MSSLGDEHRLHQPFANLLSNARTHTPPGTTVTTQISQAIANRIEVRVEDDRQGIDAGALPHIFERFMRADIARSHRFGNSGLGLPITEAIIHAHRATIAVTSRPGRTAFTVVLPASTAQHGDGPTQ